VSTSTNNEAAQFRAQPRLQRHQRVLQIAPAHPGWWAQFSDGHLEPISVWALMEDEAGEPVRFLGAYLEGDEYVTTPDIGEFERYLFDPRARTLRRWLRKIGRADNEEFLGPFPPDAVF
jgi:hypothetical protein